MLSLAVAFSMDLHKTNKREKKTQRAAHRVWYFVGWEHKATRNWKKNEFFYLCILPVHTALIVTHSRSRGQRVCICVSLVNRINFVDCRDFLLGTALLVQSQIIVITHLFVKIRRDNYRFQWICYCWALLHALMGCLWKLIIKQVSNTYFFGTLNMSAYARAQAHVVCDQNRLGCCCCRW